VVKNALALRPRRFLPLRCLAVLLVAGGLGSRSGAAPAPATGPQPSDAARDLAALDERISSLRAEIGLEEGGLTEGRLAYALVERSALTADFADFRAAEEAIEAARGRLGPIAEVVLLRAQLDLKVHRLAAAEAALESLAELAADPATLSLRGDIALQRGRYGIARALYLQALAAKRSWDALARLAYLEAKTGRQAEALKLYGQAADLLTAKEMRHYSWISLQLGLLELEEGRNASALAHFERAERSYSGDWQVAIHRAEALGRLGRVEEAIALDRELLDRTRNPEVANDLGLLLARRDPAEAARLFALADAGFAARLALYPEAAIGHLIEARLARGEASDELVAQAEEGYRLRSYGPPGELLAKAYLLRGETARAEELSAQLAAGGWRTRKLTRGKR
jgi:tetratricopeptide (TPR) repeat protein